MPLLTLQEYKFVTKLQTIQGKLFSMFNKDNNSKGNIYIKMARNILSNLPIDVLYRMDVDFRISEKNLDSFIGRTAHI